MISTARGYWVLTWIGLIANVAALPLIALVAFGGPPMQTATISLAISLAWPASIVGIVSCAGLMAEKRWGVVLAIVSLSMALAFSLPYGVVRLILVGNVQSISYLSLSLAILNLSALIYWCRPIHRKIRRL
tara:strand:+ start:465 stop:857 length:393 start_codon:yes stop_codon:yes gene_type:complete